MKKYPSTVKCPSCTRTTFECKRVREDENAEYKCNNCGFGRATYSEPEDVPQDWREENLTS